MPTFDNVMRTIYNIIVVALLSVCVLGCGVINEDAMPSHEKTTLVRVGEAAPDFTIKMLDGKSLTLSQLQGRTVLLVFFASWCPDCHSQLKALRDMQDRFDSEKFAILAISRGEKIEVVRDFVSQCGYTFPIGVDSDSQIYSLYATEYVPRCFVIDPLGRIVALSTEYKSEEFELLCNVISSLM